MSRVDWNREWSVLGAALDAFNGLESVMAKVIVAYVAPRAGREGFLRTQLLHSSCVSFGSKVKLILTISRAVGGPRMSRDNLHKVLAIRNALAHGDGATAVRRNVNALRPEPYGEYLVVESLKGDGSFDETPRSAAVSELISLMEQLRPQLDELATKARNHDA